jgi:Rrf2 family nitric oxide-sensitive transcriptional repressor
MQLTLHADYSLRVLLYLGSQPSDRIVTTREISVAYGISRHHLVRVIQTLSEHGYVSVSAGRRGGVALARAPEKIGVGAVVRDAEANLKVVECFDPATNTCPIIAACRLKPALRQALNAFLGVLDGFTLADMLGHGGKAKLTRAFMDS